MKAYEEFAMRHQKYYDRLDSNDRKKIRRIFYQITGLYMSLIVIAIAGVAVRSAFTTLPEVSFRQNVHLD
jgi:hypothetical protein